MERLGQYVISVTAAALICGIVSGVVKNNPAKEVIRMLCGLLLTVTVLHPFADIDFSALSDFSLSYAGEGELLAASGEEAALTAMADIIKAESEAYILDKAAGQEVSITVEVSVSQELMPVPAEVRISGNVSPYDRQQLSQIIQKDLGIAKENQIWTG